MPPKKSEPTPEKNQRRKQAPRVRVEGEASVKVEASYRRARTHNVTETIPEDVSRAKSEAWLDILSPVREWLGLKGDILRHKREQLNLQRQATLHEIGRLVGQSIPTGTVLPSLPPKFMVPFVEQASLDEPSSPLVELWANLLTSAIENYDGQFLHFSRIIAGLSAKQAQIFKENFTASDLHRTQFAFDDVSIFFGFSRIQKSIENEIARTKPKDDDEFCDCIIELLDNSTIHVVHAAFESSDGYYDIDFPYETARDRDTVDYSILVSIGLISLVSTDFMGFSEHMGSSQKWSLAVTYYHLTSLGNAFAAACKMRPPGSEPEI